MTAEQTQRQAQRSYDDAAKAAVDAQAKADANRKAASGAKAKATDARTKADAAKGALGDAASKESGAKGALDKAVSDKAAADATAKGAKDALAKARSTEAAAEVDVTKKEATARGAKNALDAAQKAYDSAPEGRKAMTVAEFLDSISHGKYTEWATKGGANEDGVYADIADPSKTNKANGSNMIYANFLKALDLIDYLNKYRTEHGLSPLTVSGYHMAGQMLECDLVDGVDGIQNHTTFGGFASYKDISWGWANPVDGWLRERDVFKKDAESYAKSGEADAAYKTALADVDWSNEPFVHAFYNMHVAKINAYVLKTEGRMHEYGHWTSLTSEDNEYIGMGFNASPGQAYSNTATAAGSGPIDGDVTGTTDFFRNLARAAESGTSSNKPELKKMLDAAKAASDEATAKANAAQSKADALRPRGLRTGRRASTRPLALPRRRPTCAAPSRTSSPNCPPTTPLSPTRRLSTSSSNGWTPTRRTMRTSPLRCAITLAASTPQGAPRPMVLPCRAGLMLMRRSPTRPAPRPMRPRPRSTRPTASSPSSRPSTGPWARPTPMPISRRATVPPRPGARRLARMCQSTCRPCLGPVTTRVCPSRRW